MIRTLFTALVLTVMTLTLAPLAALGHLLLPQAMDRRVAQFCMQTWARSLCFAAGARVVVHGREHMLAGGAVYASNHVSWFDIFAIASVLPRYTFVAKAELRRIPIFGWGAEAAGVVFLERENRTSAFEAYRGVAKKVAEGLNVVVCPEGTRGPSYSLRPFKKGPFVLAIASHAPVVPVLVYGAREVMAKGEWRIRSNQIHVHFLEPVSSEGMEYSQRHDLMRVVWERIADTMATTYHVGTGEFAIASAPGEERSA